MKIGKYRIKKQIGNKPYYAYVELAVEKSKSLEIIWDDITDKNLANNPYINGVIFGIHTGLSEYAKITNDYSKFEIFVSEFLSMAVDSSPTIVAYAASRAVLNALLPDHEPEFPELKGEEGLFVFQR